MRLGLRLCAIVRACVYVYSRALAARQAQSETAVTRAIAPEISALLSIARRYV
jgi:hypothetical protein